MSKEKETWNEDEWGPLDYREFTECPMCHCQNRYAVEALRGDIPDEQLEKKPPAFAYLEHTHDTAFYRIRLLTVVDSCCRCGALIAIARSRTKTPIGLRPRGGDMPGMMRGR